MATGVIEDTAFEAVERSSLSTQAYQQIRKALMVGEFKSGQKLSAREIATRLGVSLTPVREALLQLVAEGALEARMGQSLTVPTPSRGVFEELSRIRVETEGLGAEQAAATIDAAGVARLESVHETLMAAKLRRDYAEVLRTNEAFHLGLCRAAAMPRLLRVVESLWAQNGPFLPNLYSGPEGSPVRPEPHPHLQVLDALRRRDGPAARRAIAEDIWGGGAELMRRLPE